MLTGEGTRAVADAQPVAFGAVGVTNTSAALGVLANSCSVTNRAVHAACISIYMLHAQYTWSMYLYVHGACISTRKQRDCSTVFHVHAACISTYSFL